MHIGSSHHNGHAHAGSSKRSLPVHPRPHAKRAGGPDVIGTAGLPAATSTIASVLATPCEDTELTPEAGNLEQIRTATLCLVNQERARNDELPLARNDELEQAARDHSEDMIGANYFAHIAPDGETPVDRVKATGYIPSPRVGYTLGENIAWGTLYLATPSAIVAAWIASPEHLSNILDSEYRDTAIGVDPAAPPSLADNQAGAVYTQEFGVIVG
jgi:uncharacterized protein YkwD